MKGPKAQCKFLINMKYKVFSKPVSASRNGLPLRSQYKYTP